MNRAYQIRENGATTGAGLLAVYQYDNLSRKQTLTRGNGTSTGFQYDLASRLGTFGHDVAGTAQDISLTYQYTLASQLQVRSSSNALYDWLPAAANITYVPDGLNRYATVAGTQYAYDTRGNMTSDGTNGYTYDVENRLLTASGPTAVTLSYDPLGRLQQTMVGTAQTQYLYDGTKLVAEYDGSGNALRRYVHGPGTDDPVIWYEGSTLATRYYLHADERGTIIAASDNSGSAAANIYTYGPYGEPTPGWTGSRFRYTGQTAIPEAHLYYYKARMYSPSLGRFLQTDPIGTKDDLNLYAYVGDDPIDRVDPSGTCTGSRIENTDGTCTGGGGDTTQSNVDQHKINRERKAQFAAALLTLTRTRNALAATEVAGAATGPGDIPAQGAAVGIAVVGGATACVQACVAAVNAAIDQVKSVIAAIEHGNSLASTRPTWVYKLISNRSGDVLKFGITSESNPINRYPAWFYEVGNFSMVPLAQYPARAPARADEVSRCTQYTVTQGSLPPLSFGC
jgi:RHS repeat-associated protein